MALSPDLVVLDREENRREDADALVAAGLRIHVTHVLDLAGVGPELRAMAAAAGIGSDVASAVAEQIGATPAEPPAHRAFVPIWRRPWMTVNRSTYGASVLAHLGVDNVFASDPERYPTVELDDAIAREPSLVLLPTEPYPFRAVHVEELRSRLPRADVRIVDGRDLFWWGARTPAALARLRAALRAGPPPV